MTRIFHSPSIKKRIHCLFGNKEASARLMASTDDFLDLESLEGASPVALIEEDQSSNNLHIDDNNDKVDDDEERVRDGSPRIASTSTTESATNGDDLFLPAYQERPATSRPNTNTIEEHALCDAPTSSWETIPDVYSQLHIADDQAADIPVRVRPRLMRPPSISLEYRASRDDKRTLLRPPSIVVPPNRFGSVGSCTPSSIPTNNDQKPTSIGEFPMKPSSFSSSSDGEAGEASATTPPPPAAAVEVVATSPRAGGASSPQRSLSKVNPKISTAVPKVTSSPKSNKEASSTPHEMPLDQPSRRKAIRRRSRKEEEKKQHSPHKYDIVDRVSSQYGRPVDQQESKQLTINAKTHDGIIPINNPDDELHLRSPPGQFSPQTQLLRKQQQELLGNTTSKKDKKNETDETAERTSSRSRPSTRKSEQKQRSPKSSRSSRSPSSRRRRRSRSGGSLRSGAMRTKSLSRRSINSSAEAPSENVRPSNSSRRRSSSSRPSRSYSEHEQPTSGRRRSTSRPSASPRQRHRKSITKSPSVQSEAQQATGATTAELQRKVNRRVALQRQKSRSLSPVYTSIARKGSRKNDRSEEERQSISQSEHGVKASHRSRKDAQGAAPRTRARSKDQPCSTRRSVDIDASTAKKRSSSKDQPSSSTRRSLDVDASTAKRSRRPRSKPGLSKNRV